MEKVIDNRIKWLQGRLDKNKIFNHLSDGGRIIETVIHELKELKKQAK